MTVRANNIALEDFSLNALEAKHRKPRNLKDFRIAMMKIKDSDIRISAVHTRMSCLVSEYPQLRFLPLAFVVGGDTGFVLRVGVPQIDCMAAFAMRTQTISLGLVLRKLALVLNLFAFAADLQMRWG